MIENLADVLGIDSIQLFSKQVEPLQALNSLKITALIEVEGLTGHFIKGQNQWFFTRKKSLQRGFVHQRKQDFEGGVHWHLLGGLYCYYCC